MKESEFKSAVQEKTTKVHNDDPDNQYHTIYKYTPLDECPNCGEYEYRYLIFEKTGIIATNKYLRKAYCYNCELEEFVDSDPTKGSFEDLS